MKNIIIFLLIFVAVSIPVWAQNDNELSPAEKDQGWVLLFDGKTSQGWQSNQGDQFPEKGWEIKDGELTVLPTVRGGDIITTQAFENFELVIDFKFDKGANSGIKYFIQKGSSIGCEYQILDDANHPDANMGVNHCRQLGSLYDLLPTAEKTVNPVGEWNHARIIVRDGHAEHWLNGGKLLEYDRFSPCFRQLIQHSKFKNEKDFATFKTGHILLQDHGDRVSFKNIKIRKL